MMLYRHRASPKLRNDMTEVEYGGGGHRTRLRNDHEDQLVCSRVPPASVYKGAKGEGAAGQGGRAKGSPTPTGSRTPSFLVQLGEGGKGGEWRRKGEGGRAPNPLSNSDWAWEGRAPPPGSFPLRPIKAQYSSPYSRNSPVLRKIPESLGTLPVSEYSRPIYQSLCLDHSETPRYVRDHIRDSEQPLVHQNT